jgi:hypothetical protein
VARVITRTKTRGGKKDYTCGACGKKIAPGEIYHKWSFRYGGTHYRCKDHYPRRGELTQSKMGTIYDAIDDAQKEIGELTSAVEIEDAVHAVAQDVQEAVDEYREAAEHFGGQGESAERADELEGWQSDLDSWRTSVAYDDEETMSEDTLEEIRQEACDALDQCPY